MNRPIELHCLYFEKKESYVLMIPSDDTVLILCIPVSFVFSPSVQSIPAINYRDLGPVVQSIVTSSLRGQLVKCFRTLLPNTLKFFVKKMREAFALQKLLTFFQQKILAYLRN